jgi:hypothetical protein
VIRENKIYILSHISPLDMARLAAIVLTSAFLLGFFVPAFGGTDEDQIKELMIDSSSTASPAQQYSMIIQIDDDIDAARDFQFDLVSDVPFCANGTANVTPLVPFQIFGFNENPGAIRVLAIRAADATVDGPLNLFEIICTVRAELLNGTVVNLGFENIVLGNNTHGLIPDVSGEGKQVTISTVQNEVPTANDQNVSVALNTPKVITLTGTDPENASLTFSIVNGPENGTLGIITQVNNNTAQVTYTPDANFTGPDSFTFRVNDGVSNSNTAMVNITVQELPALAKGDPDGMNDGTKLGDITLTIDFFLQRKTPTSEQLFAADIDPAKDGAQTCGNGQISLGDITTLTDVFLERKNIVQQC